MYPDDAPDRPRPLWGPAVRLGAQQLPHPGTVGSPPANPPDSAAETPVLSTPEPLDPEPPSLEPPSLEHSPTTGGGGRRVGLIAGLAVVALFLVTSVVLIAQQKSTSPATAPAPAQPASSGGGVRTAESSATPAPAIGTSLVRVTSTAASHPYAASVAALLHRHFTAINQRDYASWSATVVAQRASDQSQSAWLKSYRSTTDESVVVTSISAGSTELTVGLSFTSIQDPVDAPADLPVTRICWEAQWPVVDISNGGRIRAAAKGSTTKRAC